MSTYNKTFEGGVISHFWFGNNNVASGAYITVSSGVLGTRYTYMSGVDPNFTGNITYTSNIRITDPGFVSGNCGYGRVLAITPSYFEVFNDFFPHTTPQSNVLVGASGMATGLRSLEVADYSGVNVVRLPYNHFGDPIQSFWDRMSYPDRPISGKFDLGFTIRNGDAASGDWGQFLGLTPNGAQSAAPDVIDPYVVIGNFAANNFVYMSGIGADWYGHVLTSYEQDQYRTMRGYHLTTSGTLELNSVNPGLWGSDNLIRNYHLPPEASGTWIQFPHTQTLTDPLVDIWVKSGPVIGFAALSFTADGGLGNYVTESLTRSGYIHVNASACFGATPTSGNANLSVSFDSSCSICPPTGWLWNFGDGSSPSTTANPTHLYTKAGAHDVTLQVWSSGTTDTLTRSSYITVNMIPEFIATPTAGGANLPVNFTDLTSGTPTSWLWDFGDGSSTSTSQNPNHTYLNAGLHSVSLTATNAGTSATLTKDDYITVTPSAYFVSDIQSGVVPFEVDFDSSASLGNPTGWLWDFGDGGSSTVQNPDYVYGASGLYTVSLTIFRGGIPDTFIRMNYITALHDPGLPPSGNATDTNYRVVLTNKNAYPSNVSGDYITSKVDIITDKTFSYLKDIPVELWLNWTRVWAKDTNAVTGQYGNCIIQSNTSGITAPITNCLGVALATIDGQVYASNPVRYNFYSGEEVELSGELE